jgi:hypothetical protein
MFKVHHSGNGSPHQYGDANHALIKDGGQLVLLTNVNNGAGVVAVYAPGAWVYAEHVKPAPSPAG